MKREPVLDMLTPEILGYSMSLRRTWRFAAVALAFALVSICVVFWRTGAAMVGIWSRSETFAHGFIVVPIALLLIWRVRADLVRVAPRPSWWVLAPLAVAGAGWLLGELGMVNALAQFSFVAMLALAVPVVLGTQVARMLAFPLGFLFFAVPVGEFVMPQLMEWTADVTVLALKLSGIPVYREGQNFNIPSGSWSVVEACSGVRYLIASVVLGTLFAYINYQSTARRVIFIGFSIAVPIVANWGRAYMIVMLGHLSGNKLAVGVDHLIYGWLFFGMVILLMFWVGAHWREDGAAPQEGRRLASESKQAGTSTGEFLLVAVAVAVTTIVWPLGIRVLERNYAVSSPLLSALSIAGAWHASSGGLTSWRPHFESPSTELHETFRHGDTAVGLYVGYYRNQSSGQKLVSSNNVLVKSTDTAWARVGGGTSPVDVDGNRFVAGASELRGPGGERLVARHWYWIDGRLTASSAWAKAYTALTRLKGRGDDSAVVVIYTRKARPGEADAVLDAFILDAGPAIAAALARTRDQR